MSAAARRLFLSVDCGPTAAVAARLLRPALHPVALSARRRQRPCVRSFASAASSSSSHPRVQDISPLLQRSALFHEAAYLQGDWLPASASSAPAIDVHNPSTGAVIGRVPSLTAEQVTAAVSASVAAQAHWASRTAAERSRVIRRWCELLLQHEADVGTLMTLEQGKPRSDAAAEVEYAASFLDVYAAEATRLYGEIIASPSPSSRILVTQQPVGVVAAITPWNFPAAMVTRKVGAALAAGCSVLLKPSELTPFTALALCHLALEAGLPQDVFQVLTGEAREIGGVLTSHPDIRKLTFTGSTRVGKMLIQQTADTVKRTSMELGGNAPLLVFEDADVQAAVRGIISSKFRNCGQTCVTVNRVLVQETVLPAVLQQLQAAMRALAVGDGMAEGSVVGPLINEQSVQKVERHVEDALSRGGRLLAGGRRWTSQDSPLIPQDASRLYFAPTLIADADRSAAAWEEETFGPACFVYRFRDEEEAVRLANSTRAGLAAYAFTRDIGRIDRLSRRLEFGMIGINQGSVSQAVAPFGGVKESGYGREGSHHGLRDYLDIKTMHIAV